MKETDPSLHSSVQDDQVFVQLAQTCSHPEPVEGSLPGNWKLTMSNEQLGLRLRTATKSSKNET
ncbi:hypothetical protein [Marinifilum fragile]|uniref:hypothetical protein n=1 Tax=Marinifilum fragile TaxID=570161 RepID=UPI002AABA0DE|nr:hypothetical protein [Marinifilum fragile]